jgi:hypothetical protein
MRRQDHVVQLRQRVIGGQELAFEVVQPGAPDLARLERGDQRVGVVDLRSCGVQVHDAVAHFGELVLADHARRLLGHRGVHGDHVAALEELIERTRGVGGVGVIRQDVHAQAAQAPAGGAAHGTQTDEAGRPAGQLPGPVALVGDLPVAVDLARPHVLVGGDQSPRGGEEQGHGQLRHGVGIAAGCAQDGHTGRSRCRHVDVGGVAPTAGDGDDRLLVQLGSTGVTFDHDQVGALGRHPLGQLLRVVDAKLREVEP